MAVAAKESKFTSAFQTRNGKTLKQMDGRIAVFNGEDEGASGSSGRAGGRPPVSLKVGLRPQLAGWSARRLRRLRRPEEP